MSKPSDNDNISDGAGVAILIAFVVVFLFLGGLTAWGHITGNPEYLKWETIHGNTYVEYHDSLWTLTPVEMDTK